MQAFGDESSSVEGGSGGVASRGVEGHSGGTTAARVSRQASETSSEVTSVMRPPDFPAREALGGDAATSSARCDLLTCLWCCLAHASFRMQRHRRNPKP